MSDIRSICVQMQYGSIGWAVGATLGVSQALRGKKRVIASIGDGSFQVTAQVCMAALAQAHNSTAIRLQAIPCEHKGSFERSLKTDIRSFTMPCI